MQAAFLLIALGFGYKIFVEACQQKSKGLKRLGKIIAVIVMLISFLATACMISCGFRMCLQEGYCPLMPKMGMSAKMCPMMGKSGDMMGSEGDMFKGTPPRR